MAGPACMSGDGNPAVLVATMLATGDAFALCDECLVGWAAALLHTMTGVDPTPFLEAVSEPAEHHEPDPVAVASAIAADEAEVKDSVEAEMLAELDEIAPTLDDEPDPPPANGRRGRTSAASPAAGTENGQGADGPATPQIPESSTA